MTNDITNAAGLGNCETPNCGNPLKPSYYLIYPLTKYVGEYIIAKCRTLEDETKNEPKIAELVKVKVRTALDPEHILVDSSSGAEVTIEQYAEDSTRIGC
jgi:hypothetical protein